MTFVVTEPCDHCKYTAMVASAGFRRHHRHALAAWLIGRA